MHVTGPGGHAGHELLLETGDWSTLLSLETTEDTKLMRALMKCC
jgi:hypothetical protein